MLPGYRVANSTSCQDSWLAWRGRTNSKYRAEFALVWRRLAEILAILAGFSKTIRKYIEKSTSRKTNKQTNQGTQDFTNWNINMPCEFYKIGNHFKVSNYFSSVVKSCTSAKCNALINLVLIWKTLKKLIMFWNPLWLKFQDISLHHQKHSK